MEDIPYGIKESEYRLINGENREYMVIRDDGEEVYAGDSIRKLLDEAIPNNRYVVGMTKERDGLIPIILPTDADRHTHGCLFGTTGCGKSTLMMNNLLQKIKKGHGVMFCDAKKGQYGESYDSIDDIDIDGIDGAPDIGEDTLKLLKRIPEDRMDDVVYVNAKPIGGNSIDFNPLQLPEVADKNRSTRDEMAHIYKEIVKNIIKSIGEDDMFGARMQQVFDDITIGMIKSDRNYTLADLHYMLTVEEEDNAQEDLENSIKKFAELEDFGDEWLEQSIETVSEISETEALERRTDRLIGTSDSIRGFLANPENDLDLGNVLKEEKILILDIQVSEDSIKQAIVNYVLESLRLLSEDVSLDKAFYNYIDEFQNIYPNNREPVVKYDTLLAQGRSNKFLMVYGTQSPNSISNFLSDETFVNTNTAITGQLKGGDVNTVKPFFKTSGRRGKSQKPSNAIERLDKNNHEFLVRTPKGSVGIVQALPPYPPIRSTEDAVRLAYHSCSSEGYGSPHSYRDKINEIVQDILLEDDVQDVSTSERVQIIDVAIKYEDERGIGEPHRASESTIREIIKHSAPSVDTDDYSTSEFLEQLENMGYVESDADDEERVYSITELGRKENLNLSTGTSGSAGKGEHRSGLSKIRNQLARYGVYVTLPEQGGSEDIADGIGRVFDDDLNPFDVETGERFRIEYEKSTTNAKPYKMMSNLAKANGEELVVFTSVNEKTCLKIRNILNRGGYKKHGKIENEYPLYNKDSSNHLKQNAVLPLRKIIAPNQSGTDRNRWYLSEDCVKLYEKTSKGGLKATISLPTSLEWDKEDFPAYAVKRSKGWEVFEDGNKVGKFSSVDNIKEDSNYRKVIEPWIPHEEFDGEIPDKYEILLVNTNSNENIEEPSILNGEEYVPLSEYDTEEEDETDGEEDDKEIDEFLGI